MTKGRLPARNPTKTSAIGPLLPRTVQNNRPLLLLNPKIIRSFAALFRLTAVGMECSPLSWAGRTNPNNFNSKMEDLIKIAEQAFDTGKQFPSFKAGDTVTVAYKIVEGNKERIQLFRGVVIKISGHQNKKRFTVRKMSGNVGVERIFPIESPNIDSIQVNKIGKVRRAKLYYLRNLTGKKARIKEKRTNLAKEA